MAEADFDLDGALTAPSLRVDLLTPAVKVPPGEPAQVELQVLNTTPVIETVEVRMLGVFPESIRCEPPRVTLFPGESERVTLELRFSPTLASGLHEATLLIVGTSEGAVPSEVTLYLEVPEHRDLDLTVEPPLRVGGKKTNYTLRIDNTGNTPMPVQVRATDADKVLTLFVDRPSISLGVDRYDEARLDARGKRPWTGTPIEHSITITADHEEISVERVVRFRQKPRLTAGFLTILLLIFIVVLWAIAMYFGVRFALAPDDPTKTMPETLFEGIGLDTMDPTLVGGSVSGAVFAVSTGQPLPRVTIEAFDINGELVGATATGDDGAYELAGLLPSRYRLRIRAEGFETVWWPNAIDASGAEQVAVPALGAAEDLNVQLSGLPGSLGGQAVLGDDEPVTITVEVIAVDLREETPPVLTTADEFGFWELTGLQTPATYRVIYRAPGYAPVDVTQPLDGGETLVLNPDRMVAALGSISGIVSDERTGQRLGGVEVLAQRGDDEVGTVTPTSGEIGVFSLVELETPGTYLITFTLEGYASETIAVRLGPGQPVEGLAVSLSPASGTVSGQVFSNLGAELGGVTVTVSGGGLVLTTDTFTSGAVGSFRLAGLPLPGVYTVTFDLEGFGRETVQVSLSRESPDAIATAVLTPVTGRIVGRVVDAETGNPIGAVVVQVSDGERVRETTTASAPAEQLGRFSVGDLAAGTYTVSAEVPGFGTETVLQTVGAAQTVEVELRVTRQ